MTEQPPVPQGQSLAPSGPGDPVSEQTDRALATRRAARVAEPPPDWMTPRADGAAAAAVGSGPVPATAAGATGASGATLSDLTAPVDPADADLFEDGWSAPRRTSRVTAVLTAGIVAAAGFAGGTYLQRNHDQGLIPTASAAGAGARAGFGPGGPGAVGFGAGGFGAGAGAGRSTSSAGAGTGTGSTGAANQAPAVVGTVSAVDATTLTVKNFGGAAIVVHLSDTTTVTTTGLGGLKAGATVAVFGTKAADGTVTASSIVSRKAG